MPDISDIKNQLFFTSLALGLTSSIGILTPNPSMKMLSLIGVGTGLSGLIATQIVIPQVADELDKLNSSYNNELALKDDEIASLNQQIQLKTQEISDLHLLKTELAVQIQSLKNYTNDKESELLASRRIIDDLRQKLQTVGQFSTKEARKIVRDTYNRAVKKLEALLNALIRNYPDIAAQLQQVLLEVDSFKSRYLSEVNDYEEITSFEELLDVGLDLQEKIIDRAVELKVKAQTLIIRHLSSMVDDSVPLDEYDLYLSALAGQAKAQIENLTAEYEKNKQAIITDWVASNNEIIERYNGNYSEVLDTAKYSVERMGTLENRIWELEGELSELRKPLKFFGESVYANAGNAISQYYYQRYGYLLDGISWEETEIGYKLIFAIRRHPGLTKSELYADNSPEQIAAFTNALKGTLPEWDFNYQNCTLILAVQLRRAKLQAATAEDKINKIWIPAAKFESYVRNWERVRITSGSTGGKSPTAKVLALAIINARLGEGTIKLYDPQHGSKKDKWDIPKAGITHEDNIAGMKALCDELDFRTASRAGKHPFVLYIFDEVDSTIAKHCNGAKFRDLVVYSLNQGSHQDLGCIYIGQSADANTIPGMTHSQWSSAYQLHIGSNAGIWIDKSTTVTTEEKTKLLNQYRTIQEYCERMNEELGLDIYEDAGAYRFALAVPLSGLPKFIQIPSFDSYDYYQVMSQNSHKLELANNNERVLDSQELIAEKPKIQCPSCQSQSCKRNGKRGNMQRYKCNDCGKDFVAEVIS